MSFYWVHQDTEVFESEIEGRGRRTTSSLGKDVVVCVAGGKAYLRSEVDWKTGLLVDENVILQLPHNDGYEAFLNHSCSPNLYLDGQIVFRTLREIAPGEELTVDYGTFMVIEKNIIEMCRCGASNCRGVIRGDDYCFLDLPLSHYAKKKRIAYDSL